METAYIFVVKIKNCEPPPTTEELEGYLRQSLDIFEVDDIVVQQLVVSEYKKGGE